MLALVRPDNNGSFIMRWCRFYFYRFFLVILKEFFIALLNLYSKFIMCDIRFVGMPVKLIRNNVQNVYRFHLWQAVSSTNFITIYCEIVLSYLLIFKWSVNHVFSAMNLFSFLYAKWRSMWFYPNLHIYWC